MNVLEKKRDEALIKGKRYFQENPNEMVSLYRELYGETISCSTCKDHIGNAFDVIRRNSHKPISKYKIKPEIRKISNEFGYFTNYNLTDEIAEMLISKGYQSYFIW